MNYKILNSGISVNADAYYLLLEWKDKNMQEFIAYCDENNLPRSINAMNIVQYNKVVYKALSTDKPILNS